MDSIKVETSNHLGISKILDCKINESGKQMYRVKWEPTWEPAENLVHCQHLVDEFWSYVNKLKTHENTTFKHRRKVPRLETQQHEPLQNFRLSDNSKESVKQLIAHTSSTSPGHHVLCSPSSMLKANQVNGHQIPKIEPDDKKTIKSATSYSSKGSSMFDMSPNSSGKVSCMGAAGLKYIESFDNPYVKIIIVCRICNKEQSLKHVSSWRQHYLIHSDQTPYKCQYCSMSFKRNDYLRNHMYSKHSEMLNKRKAEPPMFPKSEHF